MTKEEKIDALERMYSIAVEMSQSIYDLEIIIQKLCKSVKPDHSINIHNLVEVTDSLSETGMDEHYYVLSLLDLLKKRNYVLLIYETKEYIRYLKSFTD